MRPKCAHYNCELLSLEWSCKACGQNKSDVWWFNWIIKEWVEDQ